MIDKTTYSHFTAPLSFPYLRKGIILLILGLGLAFSSRAQELPELDSIKMLLTDPTIQMESTFGIDNMYNFQFKVAESQFRWLKAKYERHPLPNFLLGLSQWWKIMPDIRQTQYDLLFLTYMDSSIYYAERLLENPETEVEGAFFLSASYAFKSRLYSEREKWRKAAVAGKRALNYLEESKGKGYLSPELLFGDGLYNYYSVWIPENYPALKPILLFFSKGDKQKGVEQLEEVCREGFYTRIEAFLYLMRIYAIEENKNAKAFHISEYLHQTYPKNPYFHRFYARMLFTTNSKKELQQESEEILKRIDEGWTGYEATSGRYAAYYLAYLHRLRRENDRALHYFKRTVTFAESIEAFSSGYYLSACNALGQYYEQRKEMKEAKKYYDKVLEYADKKKSYYDEAKSFKKDFRKYERQQKREARKNG